MPPSCRERTVVIVVVAELPLAGDSARLSQAQKLESFAYGPQREEEAIHPRYTLLGKITEAVRPTPIVARPDFFCSKSSSEALEKKRKGGQGKEGRPLCRTAKQARKARAPCDSFFLQTKPKKDDYGDVPQKKREKRNAPLPPLFLRFGPGKAKPRNLRRLGFVFTERAKKRDRGRRRRGRRRK